MVGCAFGRGRFFLCHCTPDFTPPPATPPSPTIHLLPFTDSLPLKGTPSDTEGEFLFIYIPLSSINSSSTVRGGGTRAGE